MEYYPKSNKEHQGLSLEDWFLSFLTLIRSMLNPVIRIISFNANEN